MLGLSLLESCKAIEKFQEFQLTSGTNGPPSRGEGGGEGRGRGKQNQSMICMRALAFQVPVLEFLLKF